MEPKKLTQYDLNAMDKRSRLRLVNSVAGFKSVNLIGTCDTEGNDNLAVVSSVIHLGTAPPLIGFVVPPERGERHTLDNILATGRYTINAVTCDFFDKAHQTSAPYLRSQSEFDCVGLTPAYQHDFPAPRVKESPLSLGIKLRERMTISANYSELIVGEIDQIWVSNDAIMPDGYIDLETLGIVTVSGQDSYHTTERLQRLSRAATDKQVYPLTIEGDPSSWQALGKFHEWT
ncbi:flavin oxidoreductase [Vibrio sp. SM6]|uniref:Flavin oxidoreductase n=1 Tax=Vibrio agarilyticus TaxID=2726741 RepID=A0A7X8YFU1_9VIBR|nr:flavin reductase [Vibrio agarilyticus]NLS12009.1 flavin oxidoreductase [Vibrio agarilyticus]